MNLEGDNKKPQTIKIDVLLKFETQYKSKVDTQENSAHMIYLVWSQNILLFMYNYDL